MQQTPDWRSVRYNACGFAGASCRAQQLQNNIEELELVGESHHHGHDSGGHVVVQMETAALLQHCRSSRPTSYCRGRLRMNDLSSIVRKDAEYIAMLAFSYGGSPWMTGRLQIKIEEVLSCCRARVVGEPGCVLDTPRGGLSGHPCSGPDSEPS